MKKVLMFLLLLCSVGMNAQNYKIDKFEGKYFKGEGNGGGLFTQMIIHFLPNKKCVCSSDWYQAYQHLKDIKGTYDIKNNKLIVKCVDDDNTDYEFKFNIKDDGRTIWFDNSDRSMGGSIGLDFLTLKIMD